MINFYNTFGKVSMTGEYFAELVSAAASSCYGVADMATSGPSDTVKGVLFGSDFPDKGVRVTEEDGKLVIELHIKYVVEDATGLKVKRINVSVDDIVC